MLFKTYECRRINVEQTLPSRENKNVWEKNTAIYLLYHSGGSPFGGWRHHLARWEACHWILSRPTAPYESSSLATPSSAGGTMGAGHFGQPVFMAAAAEKPNNRASPVEMHPFCRLRRRLSTGKRLTRFSGRCASLRIVFACHPGGEILAALSFVQLMKLDGKRRANFPPLGEVPPQAGIGVHFYRATGPVCLFSPPARAVVKVLSKLAPKAPTTTL